MEREIKFRAWDGKGMLSTPISTIYGLSRFFGVIPEDCKLMQYTGLKDNDGWDIYEGDVVYLAGIGDVEIEFPFIDLYQAQWENDIGSIKGNIHENPELLTKQDNR